MPTNGMKWLRQCLTVLLVFFNAGSTAIGEGILISNGVSQLNDLDEYISNAGRNADSETDSDNYEKYDSTEALQEALNEKKSSKQ